MNTRYELVKINIYVINKSFLRYNIYSNAFEVQDCRRLNIVCDL